MREEREREKERKREREKERKREREKERKREREKETIKSICVDYTISTNNDLSMPAIGGPKGSLTLAKSREY